MDRQKWNAAAGILTAALWLGLACAAWLLPSRDVSDTERRPLAQMPAFSAGALTDGSFMEDFESYSLDQFPLRESFRTLKAGFHYGVLRQKDNNGIYLSQGYAAQLEYPLHEESVHHALSVFRRICDQYLKDNRVYLSVIPDKSYYLAYGTEYPVMDYGQLLQQMQAGLPDADYVNLVDLLMLGDYYRTDTHWRQERLLPAAQRLCQAMGAAAPREEDFTVQAAEQPFYGVYYGQAALPMAPDTLYTMESALLSQCTVYHYETGKNGAVYDRQKLEGKDLYEVFLSGPVSLLRIENPLAQTDRELILFRDSFGSAIAPLLVQGYKTVTLVDIRYVSSAMLPRFLEFTDQDVLFLYSTLVLNNSAMLR